MKKSSNKKESRKPFLKLFCSAIIPTIIFAVSFISILSYLYNSTLTTAKQNTANTLFQISDSCESKINNLSEVYAVLNNIPCISEATKKSNLAYNETLSYTLNQICNSYSYLKCIYIYAPAENKIYHPGGQSLADDFFNAHSYSTYNTEYWKNFNFYHFEPYRILSPSVLVSGDDRSTVIPVVFQEITDTKQKNYLIFDVDMSSLFTTTVSSNRLTDNSNIYILNKYTHKVYSLDKNTFNEVSFSKPFIDKLLSDDKTTFESEEHTVSLYSQSNSLIGYTYFAMIPFSDIYSLIMPNIVSSFLILLTFFILALVLTFRNTKRIYNPLNTIKNTLSEEAPVSMGQNILDDINILAKSTKERLNKILPDAQEKYLADLLTLNSHFANRAEGNEVRGTITFPYNLFCVLIIQISPTPKFFDSYTPAEFEYFKYGFYTVIKNLSPPNFSLYVLPAGQDSFNIILNFDEHQHTESIDEIINQLSEYLKNDAEFIKLSIGKSSVCNNLNELNNFYDEAQRNLDELELSNARIILTEQEDNTKGISFDANTKNKLSQALLSGDSDSTYTIINNIIDDYQNSSPKIKRELYSNILTIVINIMRIKKLPYKDNKPEYEIIHDCLNQPPKNAYRDMMILVDYLLKSSSARENETADYEKIISYIDKNFKFQDLSLKFLADYFGVNLTSLSKALKSKLSTGFHEYITNLRIEEAKKLLLTTDKSIQDISQECGFSSVKTFLRVFKNIVGITPTEFRNT